MLAHSLSPLSLTSGEGCNHGAFYPRSLELPAFEEIGLLDFPGGRVPLRRLLTLTLRSVEEVKHRLALQLDRLDV